MTRGRTVEAPPEGMVRHEDIEWRPGDLAFNVDDEALEIQQVADTPWGKVASVLIRVGVYPRAVDTVYLGDMSTTTHTEFHRDVADHTWQYGYARPPRRASEMTDDEIRAIPGAWNRKAHVQLLDARARRLEAGGE
jgi:hypothetical protein